MVLKPQDVLVVLKLVSIKRQKWTYNQLAVELFMSPSEVHAAVKRALQVRLAASVQGTVCVNKSCLAEFLIHGVKYVFIPERGAIIRGIPTIYAVAPLDTLYSSTNEPLPVWPDPEGEIRGESFSPLYKSAPRAAREDKELYELLVIVDALRGGRARERDLAAGEIGRRLGQ
ncbi:MAG: hypothetical protein ACOCY3_03650 [Desulfosalsimonas sp.]